MHNIYGIVYIISNIILLISSAPASNELNKSIYEFLIQHSSLKCPYLKKTRLLDPPPSFLRYCSDYNTLKTVTSLTKETEYDILCIAYMNNYMKLCDSFPANSTIDNEDIEKAANTSTLVKTCEMLSNSKFIDDFKDAANLLSKFKSPETCARLCKELTDSNVTRICSFAAFTLNFANQIQQKLVKIETKESQQKVGENINHSNVLNKVNPQAPKPQITDKDSNSEVNDKEKLPRKQPEVQNDHHVNPVQNGVNSVQTSSHVGPMPSKTDLSSRAGGESKDEAVKPNPEDKSSIPAAGVNDDNVAVPPSTEETSTKIPEAKKENTDETEENQEVVPQLASDTGKSPQDIQLDQKLPVQSETGPLPIQNGKTSDIADVKDNILNPIDEMPPNSDDDIMEEDGDIAMEPEKSSNKVKQQPKPQETDEDVLIPPYNNSNSDEEDSFFFIYFMMVCAVFILGYLGYHNKQKVLALVIEGRRGRRGSRRGRPNSANYHKLDSNLEEAVTSSCNKNSTNIIY